MAVGLSGSKKAMIFTVVAILLVGVLIAQITIVTTNSYKQKSIVSVSRVESMNDFILSVEQDIARSMLISGYRGIISLQKRVSDNGTFISDLQSTFEELFLNGTIDGYPQDLMGNSSIIDWVGRVNAEAIKLNIDIELIPRNVIINHSTPWQVTIYLNTSLNITDSNGLASWYYTKIFSINISIVTFEDPLYTVKSQERVTNLIIKANNSDFVNDTTNDTTILYSHLNNSYYIESTDAPSFLMRFEGNLSNYTYGIESLVDLEDFSKQGLTVEDKSVIDYQYFNSAYNATDDKCTFNGMPSWFRIHKDKRPDYELNGMGVDC